MDAIMMTVLFKSLGMLLVIIGGIWIAKYGYHLYKDGAGQGRDQAAFELGNIKIKANSVGSVVMSTAFLWAYAGVLLSPNLEKKGNDIRIYSLNTPAGNLEAPVLTIKYKDLKLKLEKYEKLLNEAITDFKQKSNGMETMVRLDGIPASIDIANTKVVRDNTGDIQLWTNITAGDKRASMKYKATTDQGTVMFVPAGLAAYAE